MVGPRMFVAGAGLSAPATMPRDPISSSSARHAWRPDLTGSRSTLRATVIQSVDTTQTLTFDEIRAPSMPPTR